MYEIFSTYIKYSRPFLYPITRCLTTFWIVLLKFFKVFELCHCPPFPELSFRNGCFLPVAVQSSGRPFLHYWVVVVVKEAVLNTRKLLVIVMCNITDNTLHRCPMEGCTFQGHFAASAAMIISHQTVHDITQSTTHAFCSMLVKYTVISFD